MKQNLKRRIAAIPVVLSILAATLPAALPNVTAAENAPIYASRREVVQKLLTAADDYSPGITKEDIIHGYGDGDLKEEQHITRAETFTMVSRAFGELPAPKGNTARIAPKDVNFTDIPDWAKSPVDNLVNGGILVGTENGNLLANELVTSEQMDILIKRVFALMASNERDDFYATANKEYLDNSILPPGKDTAGGLYDLRELVDKQIQQIIMDIVNGPGLGTGYEQGSREQKIQDMFKSAADMDTRNQLGIQPLKKYLDAIDHAQTAEELDTAYAQIQKELAIGGSLNVFLMVDYRDNKKRILNIQSIMPNYTEEEYNSTDNKYLNAQKKLYMDYLMLAGETEEQAKKDTENSFKLEQMLLAYNPSPEEFADPLTFNKAVSVSELQEMVPAVNVQELIKAAGFKAEGEVVLNAPSLIEGFGKLFTDQNLDLFKASFKTGLLEAMYLNLGQDFMDAYDKYNQATTGAPADISTTVETAAALTAGILGDYIDQLYVEKHFSQEAKKDVENMIGLLIENYKERISNLDWMSEKTKKRAIKKLDNMQFFVGYPDTWETPFDTVDISPADYFGNQTQFRKLIREDYAKKQFEPNKPSLALPASTVNAYYNQFNNSMAFPAGILQAPFYDKNHSLEENLAGIGTVIAHEITHAFDNNGAKYDENGNPNDWWEEKDYIKFQELCTEAAGFYNNWEAAPGIAINGTQTLGENIADIGGMACTIDVLNHSKENPDYAKYFQAYAKSWSKAMTRENAEFLAQFDEHSSANLRTNRVVSNFQEFYDTFQVKEGDGMYIPPEDRIKIW